jgi:hypothetical protein
MYALSLKEGKGAANLDSDDDNKVIGQVVCDDEMEKVNPFDSENHYIRK